MIQREKPRMILNKATTVAMLAALLAPAAAQAEYNVHHQIVYSRQMLNADEKDAKATIKTLDGHISKLRLEQERQKNEQLSYERLEQQEQDAQMRADEARTPKERERALVDRDSLRSSIGRTRIWLAAHEQDVMKSDHLVRVDQEHLATLASAIDHLREVLKNDHAVENPTPVPKLSPATKTTKSQTNKI